MTDRKCCTDILLKRKNKSVKNYLTRFTLSLLLVTKKFSSSYPYIFKYKGNERRQNYLQDDNAWFNNNFSRLKLSEMNNRVKKEWILNSLGVEELISAFLGR